MRGQTGYHLPCACRFRAPAVRNANNKTLLKARIINALMNKSCEPTPLSSPRDADRPVSGRPRSSTDTQSLLLESASDQVQAEGMTIHEGLAVNEKDRPTESAGSAGDVADARDASGSQLLAQRSSRVREPDMWHKARLKIQELRRLAPGQRCVLCLWRAERRQREEGRRGCVHQTHGGMSSSICPATSRSEHVRRQQVALIVHCSSRQLVPETNHK
eukprot:364938-Chlamydomonas_euryale.AAC.10